MNVLPLIVLAVLAQAPDDIEDDVPPPPGDESSRVAQPEEPPAPVVEEPAKDEESRVVGTRPNAPKPVVPTTPKKPRGQVRRDADGKVIMPVRPRPMQDPVRPRVTKETGVDRAVATSQQILLGALSGVGLLACGTCLAAPMVPVATIAGTACGTPLGCLLGGACWMTLALPHTALTTVAMWIPMLGRERDVVALAAAGAAIFATNALTVVVGGIVALAISLRWARAPDAPVKDRLGLFEIIFTPEGRPREFRGADVALFFNVLAAMGVGAFLSPIVGTVVYAAVSYARGAPEEEAALKRAKAASKKAGRP